MQYNSNTLDYSLWNVQPVRLGPRRVARILHWGGGTNRGAEGTEWGGDCLLYTSDAADE